MRPFVRLYLTALVLIHAATAFASYVNVPMSRRVDESDLIVIGRVIQETSNRYKSHVAGGQACGKGEAVITVIEVLRGRLEGSHAEKLADGNYVQTIRVRHFDTLTAGEGNFNNPRFPTKYEDRLDGIWILRRSDVVGTYCATFYPWAERLDELNDVRKCIRAAFAQQSTPEYKVKKKH